MGLRLLLLLGSLTQFCYCDQGSTHPRPVGPAQQSPDRDTISLCLKDTHRVTHTDAWTVQLSCFIPRWRPLPPLHPSSSMWPKPHSLSTLHQCPQAYLEPALSSSKRGGQGQTGLPPPASKSPSQSAAPSLLSSRVAIFFTGMT